MIPGARGFAHNFTLLFASNFTPELVERPPTSSVNGSSFLTVEYSSPSPTPVPGPSPPPTWTYNNTQCVCAPLRCNCTMKDCSCYQKPDGEREAPVTDYVKNQGMRNPNGRTSPMHRHQTQLHESSWHSFFKPPSFLLSSGSVPWRAQRAAASTSPPHRHTASLALDDTVGPPVWYTCDDAKCSKMPCECSRYCRCWGVPIPMFDGETDENSDNAPVTDLRSWQHTAYYSTDRRV